MNILQAKQEIEAALDVYHRKDEDGMYVYPPVRQRPILLMGPPGIGKSAVMEQIARERGIGFVSYTMTHHTRQSAIGLPRIVTKTLDGHTTDVTVYTLSEIIASVYECMEETGCREGLLFIDEINCVSETLAPVMLQFLQNKMFGSHRVPDGWLIVAAGNPPEYNRSVRELDMVTLDRIRRIDIEPDAACWLEYAAYAGVHGAVTSWIRMNPERFYTATWNREDEPVYVTARGWEDLSALLTGCEQTGHTISEETVREFISDPRTAADFTLYYHKYARIANAWPIEDILEGRQDGERLQALTTQASALPQEQRLTLASMILQKLNSRIRHCVRETAVAQEEARLLEQWEKQSTGDQRSDNQGKGIRNEDNKNADHKNTDNRVTQYTVDDPEMFYSYLAAQEERLALLTGHGVITREEAEYRKRALARLKAGYTDIPAAGEEDEAAAGCAGGAAAKEGNDREAMIAKATQENQAVSNQIRQALHFLRDSFGDGTEYQMVCCALRGDPATAAYIPQEQVSRAGTNDADHLQKI